MAETKAIEKAGVKQNFATLKKMFNKKRGDIARMAGKSLDTEKLLSIALLNIRKNPKIMECTQISILGSVSEAAMMGIIPGDGTRKGDLIPFYNTAKKRYECQFQPRYAGFIAVAKQGSSDLGDVQGFEVCEKDLFEYEYGSNKHLKHIPSREKDRGAITHFYMMAYFKGGTLPHFDVMTVEEVEKIRDNSANYKGALHKDTDALRKEAIANSIWTRHFVEMGKKTVIKRGLKTIPWANEKLSKLADMDDRVEAGLSQDSIIELNEDEFGPVEDNDSKMAAASAAEATSTVSMGEAIVSPEEEATVGEFISELKRADNETALGKIGMEIGKAKISEPSIQRLKKIFEECLKKLRK